MPGAFPSPHRPRPDVERRAAGSLLGVALLVASLSAFGSATAEPASTSMTRLRARPVIRTDRLGVDRPAAIAYAGDSGLLLVFPAATDAATTRGELLTGLRESAGSFTLPMTLTRGRALAYDRRGQRLLVLDVAARSILSIPAQATGEFDAAHAVRLAAPRAAALRPVGMTVDPASGEAFVLDRLMRRILRFTPATDADAAGASPAYRWIDLGPLATAELTGLALDPQSGHLFTLDSGRRQVIELSTDGSQIASYDVSAVEFSDPRGLVIAPSGDQTDDPATTSLFVADAGDPSTGRGRVVELAWTTAASPTRDGADILATAAATLVRVTATSAYSPPSPDPSGVSYDSVRGRLIISDAEVDEMGIYAGKNMFETSLNGTLLRSWTTVPWDQEPCGSACNPNNRHHFISNDDADRVTDINPGADGLPGTSDDVRTTWKTNGFGCGDAEGISYDPAGNRIFIADGVNEEIYIVNPGPNGVFNGGGDDVITHFDTHVLGVTDPETVEWKAATGTLLLLASTGSKILREVTTTGTLVATTDLSFAPLKKPAGLAYAPSSTGSGMSVYIVNRGTDNNSDPRENDGTLVEISVGGTAPTNTAPSVNAGLDQSITLPAQAVLDGTVSDDGLPSPPTLTTSWTKVSGPGTVTFGNANAIDTQASFSASGTYVLQLSASDGQLSASDQVQVTVQASTGNVAPSVNAGLDQSIVLPAQAALDGTVSDDGLPSPPTLTTGWTKVSGPGTVTFGNANAVDTQASFSAAGTYVLRLSASDGQLSASDQVQITVQGSTSNVAPSVNAGLDQSIVLPAQAALDGTASDDGLPSPPTLTTSWTKVSGPGTVTFGNANAIDTQASFSAAGTYVLQLSASDGQLSASDQVQVTVLPAGSPSSFRVASGLDDVEENASGSVYTTSTDLELVFDGSNQTVGLRFVNVTIPQGATISAASVQFQADEAQSETTTVVVRGQKIGNAPPFTGTKLEVSSRARTDATVSWTPPPWTTVGQAGGDQRTADLKDIIQEIVNQSDWVSGNSIVIIITGTGHRTAESYEGQPAAAPLLQIHVQ